MGTAASHPVKTKPEGAHVAMPSLPAVPTWSECPWQAPPILQPIQPAPMNHAPHPVETQKKTTTSGFKP